MDMSMRLLDILCSLAFLTKLLQSLVFEGSGLLKCQGQAVPNSPSKFWFFLSLRVWSFWPGLGLYSKQIFSMGHYLTSSTSFLFLAIGMMGEGRCQSFRGTGTCLGLWGIWGVSFRWAMNYLDVFAFRDSDCFCIRIEQQRLVLFRHQTQKVTHNPCAKSIIQFSLLLVTPYALYGTESANMSVVSLGDLLVGVEVLGQGLGVDVFIGDGHLLRLDYYFGDGPVEIVHDVLVLNKGLVCSMRNLVPVILLSQNVFTLSRSSTNFKFQVMYASSGVSSSTQSYFLSSVQLQKQSGSLQGNGLVLTQNELLQKLGVDVQGLGLCFGITGWTEQAMYVPDTNWTLTISLQQQQRKLQKSGALQRRYSNSKPNLVLSQLLSQSTVSRLKQRTILDKTQTTILMYSDSSICNCCFQIKKRLSWSGFRLKFKLDLLMSILTMSESVRIKFFNLGKPRSGRLNVKGTAFLRERGIWARDIWGSLLSYRMPNMATWMVLTLMFLCRIYNSLSFKLNEQSHSRKELLSLVKLWYSSTTFLISRVLWYLMIPLLMASCTYKLSLPREQVSRDLGPSILANWTQPQRPPGMVLFVQKWSIKNLTK